MRKQNYLKNKMRLKPEHYHQTQLVEGPDSIQPATLFKKWLTGTDKNCTVRYLCN
jgi:hypothetical protein